MTGNHPNTCGIRFLHPLVSDTAILWAKMQNVGHMEILPFKMRDALHMGPLFAVIPSIFFSDTFFYLSKKSILRHFKADRWCLSLGI